MSSRDDVPTLAEELESVTVEDETPTAPAEAEAPAPPEAEPAASADSPDTPPVPPTPVPWSPPEGGTPFAFRADGREVPVPDALRYEHGMYFPTKSWDTVQRHLADRDAFTQRVQALQRQVEERDPQKNGEVLQARATVQAFMGLLEQGPEKVAEWLDNFEQNKQALVLQIQNQALQTQLEQRTTQYSEVEHTQAAQQLAQELPGYLKQTIDAAIANTPEFKELVSDDVFQKLWPMASYLFWEADRDYPEHGLRQGQVVVLPDRLKELLGQQAGFRSEIKRLEAAAKQNKAAVAASTAAPTVTTRGRPSPGDRSKTYAPDDRRSWKDDLRSSPED